MRRFLRTLATVAVILAAYGMCSPAAASLVFYSEALVTGTGIGVVPQILTFPSAPSDTVSGCVKWTVSGDAWGGVCPTESFGNDQDNSKSPTRTPGELSSTITPFTLAVVYNPSEPGNNLDVQVDRMVLTFYNPADPSEFSSHSLPSPVYAADGGSGSGGAGMVFGLDWEQATALAQWISTNNLTFTDVRLGLGAEVSDHQGHSYFYLAQLTTPVPVPEPLSAGLVAAGLLALGLLRRRRK